MSARQPQCPVGWEKVNGPGAGFARSRFGLQHEQDFWKSDGAEDVKACAKTCAGFKGCTSFAYAPMGADALYPHAQMCSLYSSDAPPDTIAAVEGKPKQVFCKRKVETPKCPSGYKQSGDLGSDLGGCGLTTCEARYGLNAQSSADCAEQCKLTAGCASFTYAPPGGNAQYQTGVCTLYEKSATQPRGVVKDIHGEPRQIWCQLDPNAAARDEAERPHRRRDDDEDDDGHSRHRRRWRDDGDDDGDDGHSRHRRRWRDEDDDGRDHGEHRRRHGGDDEEREDDW